MRVSFVSSRIAALAICFSVLGCTTDPIGVESEHRVAKLPNAGASGIVTMTQNLYLGADLGPILSATNPQLIPLLAAQAWQQIVDNDFPSRARALAALVEDNQPHLIGLQEVALFRIQSPSGSGQATAVALDYLAELQAALDERGLAYSPVAVQDEFDVEIPMLVGFSGPQPLLDDIRMTLRDVILARDDVPTSEAGSANYQAALPINVGGFPLQILRGWTSVVAHVARTEFRFVNTHLEVQAAAPIQVLQAQQLIGMLEPETRPVILVGDLNSAANVTQTPTYALLAESGYVDTWEQARRNDEGLTCCQDKDLSVEDAVFDQRLDLVLARGLRVAAANIVGGVHADVVGEELEERTDSGLWASDHAGVVTILRLPAVQ